ncbi:MAG: zinc-dependent alcohol dehydrogenase [Candidatus Thorarchaeota archaeon]
MQSLVLTQDGLQLADTPRPPLMPGNVRIEVRTVGICATDIAIWKGEYEANLPLVLGHEIAGVIHESSVPELRPGTAVTTEVDVPCSKCWYCRHNQTAHCKNKEVLGITTDGGLAEFVSVPAELVHSLPEGIDISTGIFIEPLASAIETCQRAPVAQDEPVVIIGSGKIGLLVAQVYDAYGANVVVVDKNRWQLGLVRQLGIPNTVNTNDSNWKEKILDLTTDVGPRVVIESTSNIAGITMALDLVRDGGRIGLKSIHGETVDLNPSEIVQRELTLFGNFAGPFKKAVDMLDKGRIEVKRLITKEFKLEDGSKAFEFASEPNTTKVVINI